MAIKTCRDGCIEIGYNPDTPWILESVSQDYSDHAKPAAEVIHQQGEADD